MKKSFNLIDSLFDKRIHIHISHVFPWSIHGYLQCRFEGGDIYRGTGTLISQDCLLTAAHCLYIRNKMGHLVPPIEILFKLGLRSDGRYAWSSIAKRFEVHPEYLKNEDESHDFAVLKLSDNIGLKAGWATLGIVEDSALRGLTVNITGYPGQKGFWDILSQKATYDMYTMQGPIAKVTGGKIYYEIDTSGGQSGSGIWVFDKDQKPICIGVHTTGSKLLGNGGVRITKDNSGLIKEWMKTMEKD